jgi:hypothetical protein
MSEKNLNIRIKEHFWCLFMDSVPKFWCNFTSYIRICIRIRNPAENDQFLFIKTWVPSGFEMIQSVACVVVAY